jgi:hypothetical protein
MINQAPTTYYATCGGCNARASKTLSLTEQGALEEAMRCGFVADPKSNQMICGKCASIADEPAVASSNDLNVVCNTCRAEKITTINAASMEQATFYAEKAGHRHNPDNTWTCRDCSIAQITPNGPKPASAQLYDKSMINMDHPAVHTIQQISAPTVVPKTSESTPTPNVWITHRVIAVHSLMDDGSGNPRTDVVLRHCRPEEWSPPGSWYHLNDLELSYPGPPKHVIGQEFFNFGCVKAIVP